MVRLNKVLFWNTFRITSVLWFLQEYPIISGLIFSIALGLPVGLSTVWTLRSIGDDPEKDQNAWDDEWDLK